MHMLALHHNSVIYLLILLLHQQMVQYIFLLFHFLIHMGRNCLIVILNFLCLPPILQVEKLIEHHNLLGIVELEETFIEGFSLAVSLLLEAISEK